MTDRTERTDRDADIPAPLVVLLAVACGVSVATNYYAQALLPVIGSDLSVGESAVGWLVTAAQLGFALGIVTLVPLGDLLPRHRLVPAMLVVTAVGLGVEAVSPNLAVLLGAAVLAALFSVAVQVLVPLAASLAAPARQGRVVGQVMSGLLIGVLLARTVAGLVSAVAGWRAVYAIAAALVLVLAVVLAVALPRVSSPATLGYLRSLVSVGTLVRAHARLRWRMGYGFLTFAGFGALWSTVALLLAAPPFGYGEATIGLLGLAGAAGALVAQGSGRLVDRGWLRPATLAFLVLLLVGWVVAGLSAHSLVGIVIAMVVIDVGVQGTHIANQSAIYPLDPTARSRLATAYMTAYFLGGALGSAAAVAAHARFGWTGVTVVGAGLAVLGVLVWIAETLSHRTGSDQADVAQGDPTHTV